MDILLQGFIYVLEFIALCLTIFKHKLLYKSSLRLMLVVIPFIFISETIALGQIVFFKGLNRDGNMNYYSITTLVTFLLYYLLYLENIRVALTRKIFLISCIVTFLFYIVNRSYIQTGNSFHTYSFTICSLCLCLGIIFYIKEIVESEKIVFISRDPLFWISIGLFAFYIINIPYMGMYNYLLVNYYDFLVMILNISMVLNILMYCSIIIGLICLKN